MVIIREDFDIKDADVLFDAVGIKRPSGIEYAIGVYDGGLLVGTGAIVGRTLQGIAIAPSYRGEGVSNTIVTHLLKKALEMRKEELIFVFTKPQNACYFENMGFNKVGDAKPYVSLLEWGRGGIEIYKERLEKHAEGKPAQAAAIVANGNPFTRGHRYLIEKAAAENPWLYIFVVEEDKSLFPFKVRYDLVKQGTADLPNVTVIPGGKYIISEATFPSYFTKKYELVKAHALLDLTIFGMHVAPCLSISKRYVGEEPYCLTTSQYNKLMKNILPKYGIGVEEVPRLQIQGQFISASKVRELIKEGKLFKTKEMVPPTTYSYLVSPKATD